MVWDDLGCYSCAGGTSWTHHSQRRCRCCSLSGVCCTQVSKGNTFFLLQWLPGPWGNEIRAKFAICKNISAAENKWTKGSCTKRCRSSLYLSKYLCVGAICNLMNAFLFPPSRLLHGWGPSFLCSSQFWKNSDPQSAKCQSPLTICVVPWGSWASTKPTRGDPPGDPYCT